MIFTGRLNLLNADRLMRKSVEATAGKEVRSWKHGFALLGMWSEDVLSG